MVRAHIRGGDIKPTSSMLACHPLSRYTRNDLWTTTTSILGIGAIQDIVKLETRQTALIPRLPVEMKQKYTVLNQKKLRRG